MGGRGKGRFLSSGTLLVLAAAAFASPGARARELSSLTDAQLDAQLAALQKERANRMRRPPTAERTVGARTGPPPHEAKEEPGPSPQPQRAFIRSDPLDGFAYIYPFEPQDGKGASISVTGNNIANTLSASVNAFGSYVIDRVDTGNGGVFAYAPFFYATGTLNSPVRSTERNALQVGMDFQHALPTFDRVGARPYFQTDFRGEAAIYGVSLVYENPYANAILAVGTPINTTSDLTPRLLRTWWRIIPEFNYFHVDDPGRTSFVRGHDYAFAGGTVQARSTLFNNMGPPSISGRIYVDGSVTAFSDLANGGRYFHDSQVEIGYIISKEKPVGPANLTTSISFIYNNGRSRYTFENRDQYKAQLNVQY